MNLRTDAIAARRISQRDVENVASRAAKDMTDASRRASVVQAIVEEPKDGTIGGHRRDMESEPQSCRVIRDSVNLKL